MNHKAHIASEQKNTGWFITILLINTDKSTFLE